MGQGPCHARFLANVKDEGALPHDDLAGRRRTAARIIDFAGSYSRKVGLRGQSVFAAYFPRDAAVSGSQRLLRADQVIEKTICARICVRGAR